MMPAANSALGASQERVLTCDCTAPLAARDCACKRAIVVPYIADAPIDIREGCPLPSVGKTADSAVFHTCVGAARAIRFLWRRLGMGGLHEHRAGDQECKRSVKDFAWSLLPTCLSPFLKAFWHRYLPRRYTSRLNFVQFRPTRYGVNFKFYQAYCKPRQNMLQILLTRITLISCVCFQNQFGYDHRAPIYTEGPISSSSPARG